MTDPNIQPPLAGMASCFGGTQYLAVFDNYAQISEKSGYDLDSKRGGVQNPFGSDDIMP